MPRFLGTTFETEPAPPLPAGLISQKQICVTTIGLQITQKQVTPVKAGVVGNCIPLWLTFEYATVTHCDIQCGSMAP